MREMQSGKGRVLALVKTCTVITCKFLRHSFTTAVIFGKHTIDFILQSIGNYETEGEQNNRKLNI